MASSSSIHDVNVAAMMPPSASDECDTSCVAIGGPTHGCYRNCTSQKRRIGAICADGGNSNGRGSRDAATITTSFKSPTLLGALCWTLAIFSVCRRPLSEALATPLVPGKSTSAVGPFGMPPRRSSPATVATGLGSGTAASASASASTTSLDMLRGGADATLAQSRGMASRRGDGKKKSRPTAASGGSATAQTTQRNVLQSRPDVSTEVGPAADDDGLGANANTNTNTNGDIPRFDVDASDLSSNDEDDEDFDANRVIPCEYVAETNLPTDIGHFRLRAYRISDGDFSSNRRNRFVGTEPCVIYAGDKPPFGIKGGADGNKVMKGRRSVPVRIHDQCFTSEVFRSQRCDCKEQLKMSLDYIKKHGGAIIYLQQEGRGIGLANKVAAYALQDVGMDTVDANIHLGFPEDCRQYGVVPAILAEMGIDSIQLITNNPRKINRLRDLGVEIDGTIPMVVKKANPYNQKYLQTKRQRMNHQNFGSLLTQDGKSVFDEPTIPPVRPSLNLNVSPGNNTFDARAPASLAEKYINEGEEMAAHAVATCLIDNDESQAGVTASADGYCFGRQSVEDAIAAVKRGELVVVVDDMDRENEGDFIMAADLCTPEQMATIVRYSSGVICVGMEGGRMDELELPAMVTNNEDPKGTAFSVTVDAAKEHGITTGISAVDRAKTMQLLASSETSSKDFVRPGHIFPLRAKSKGVLQRDGHTEAAVDLCKLAGRAPVGVLCEIVSEENPVEMARLPELKRFCKEHGYVLTSIVDIAQYRRDTDQ